MTYQKQTRPILMFDPFAATLAFSPLIVYVLCLSIIRIGGFVWVTTGARDTAAVLVAISGLIVIGPMELFFPNATASLLGAWVWIPLMLLYFLFACLVVINSRPKLVIYGRTLEEVYPAMVRAARAMDSNAIEHEEQLQIHLPALTTHIRLDPVRGNDCSSVVAFEPTLPLAFWNQLANHLRTELRPTPPPYPRRGWAMLIMATMTAFFLVRYIAAQPALLVEGFHEWFIR
ncbi:hypothetical protein Poly21_42640 [Allorhodopirellula heiligendammensis]|uniref:Uncharacterized protein n=2 Tax=Allorhodopirellula heiligendammensis TaxID=2714739 RepID=A0A5C6BYQ1_9BACT|nr:hypothetical protein Poly21_42640 [Allorhodopirellula heiligendammensis]